MIRAWQILFLYLVSFSCFSETLSVDVFQLVSDSNKNGIGHKIGAVTFKESPFGILILPDIKDFSPGMHGFHIHENPSCEGQVKDGIYIAGLAAGGHLDPDKTLKHLGPYDLKGHLGDLPPLYCDAAGSCQTEVLAPKIKLSDLMDRSVMIHAHGDNFSDQPKVLGGGGARMACGVALSEDA